MVSYRRKRPCSGATLPVRVMKRHGGSASMVPKRAVKPGNRSIIACFLIVDVIRLVTAETSADSLKPAATANIKIFTASEGTSQPVLMQGLDCELGQEMCKKKTRKRRCDGTRAGTEYEPAAMQVVALSGI